MKVGLFGTGAYGMALASVLVDNNVEVTMWTKFIEEKEQLEQTRKNEKVTFEFGRSVSMLYEYTVGQCKCHREDEHHFSVDGSCGQGYRRHP